ncbi:MAG: hypothetical protein JWP57_4415 [Spirosoma sp.]|nr:hypothetical protein [Spirosoma sp.]
MFDLFAVDGPHDPGGKTTRPIPKGWVGRAVFGGPRDIYRYRAIYEAVGIPEAMRRTMLVVMMNCSTAHAKAMDPTIFNVWKIANRLGYNRLLIGNGHAYRRTDQSKVKEIADPVGPENDRHLIDMAKAADLVVMAYGSPAKHMWERGPAVARMFLAAGIPLHVFRLAKNNRPWHPLYLPAEKTNPAPWAGPDAESNQ